MTNKCLLRHLFLAACLLVAWSLGTAQATPAPVGQPPGSGGTDTTGTATLGTNLISNPGFETKH